MKHKLLAIIAVSLSSFAHSAPVAVGVNGEGVNQVPFRTAISTYSKSEVDTSMGLKLNADGLSSTLRTARASGYNQLVQPTSELWRIVEKMRRDTVGAGGGLKFANRFRVVSLGDSVAATPQEQVQGFWGFGGRDLGIQSWTKQGAASPSDSTPTNYTSWASSGSGVFTLYDEWTRTMKGLVQNLHASKSNATYLEYTTNDVLLHSLYVQYLSGPGYGSFKLQYKTNGSGSWTDCTVATVSSGGGSQSSGLVNSDNASSETYSQAVFSLPLLDYYHLRLVATSGQVRLCAALANSGAWAAGATSGYGNMSGAICIDYAQGGRGIASHFSQWSQNVMSQAFSFDDPHVVIYKSLNEWSLSNYQTHWPALAAKIRTAAPQALLVVCGSHCRQAVPGMFDGDIAIDDYLRNWCATTEGAVFVDVRQNMPAYQTGFDSATNNIDDLWSDGVHIYDGNSSNWGGGQGWVNDIVWNAFKPACEFVLNRKTGTMGWNKVAPFQPNEIRLFDDTALSNRSNIMSMTYNPRQQAKCVLRPSDAFYNSGNQSFTLESGFGARSSKETVSPGSLYLVSGSTEVITFGMNFQGGVYQGAAVGVTGSSAANIARAGSGFRIKSPWSVYGVNENLVVESRSDSSADHRVFGIDIGATDSAFGTKLWSWNIGDGSTLPKVIYHGRTNDSNVTNFTYEEPTAATTIHTPVNATAGSGGTYTRVTAVVPSYADTTAAEAALPLGEVYYDEATKKVKVTLVP